MSLLAAQILLKVRTQNEQVNRSLLKSAKYEENQEIKYTAAAALLLNGIHISAASTVLEELQSSQSLSETTKTLVRTYLGRDDTGQCHDIFNIFGESKEN